MIIDDITWDIDPAAATSLWDLLARRAAATPDAVALIDEHDRTETFAEIEAKAERVAAGLLAAGITAGTVVSWQLPTAVDTVIVSLALSRLGAVQNPIIPLYREREVKAMVEQCSSEWLITLPEHRGFNHAALAQAVRSAGGDALNVMILDGLPDGDPATLPAPPTGRDEIKWIYTTSGTTSAPKGVCHSDGTLIAGGLSLAAANEMSPADIGTMFFPFAHIAGPDMMIAALTSGITLLAMEVYAPAPAVELMNRYGATITGGSTPHYSLLLEQQRKSPGTKVVPTLRMVTGGGAPMPEQLFRDVLDEVGVPIMHGYGMTECPMITSARGSDTVEQLATTSGRPVLGCEIQIRTEEDEVLRAGEAGRVWLRGPMLFKHYLDGGQIVRPFDSDGWLFTGDTGKLLDSGHLVLVGREKDLIIRKGESISPAEIEEVIAAMPAVDDVAVIGLPDDRAGERICAVLTLVAGETDVELSEVREFCRSAELSPAKFPEEIVIVPEMPKTPTMKIRKQNLRQSVIDLKSTADVSA